MMRVSPGRLQVWCWHGKSALKVVHDIDSQHQLAFTRLGSAGLFALHALR
jgi:hypothetical protein